MNFTRKLMAVAALGFSLLATATELDTQKEGTASEETQLQNPFRNLEKTRVNLLNATKKEINIPKINEVIAECLSAYVEQTEGITSQELRLEENGPFNLDQMRLKLHFRSELEHTAWNFEPSTLHGWVETDFSEVKGLATARGLLHMTADAVQVSNYVLGRLKEYYCDISPVRTPRSIYPDTAFRAAVCERIDGYPEMTTFEAATDFALMLQLLIVESANRMLTNMNRQIEDAVDNRELASLQELAKRRRLRVQTMLESPPEFKRDADGSVQEIRFHLFPDEGLDLSGLGMVASGFQVHEALLVLARDQAALSFTASRNKYLGFYKARWGSLILPNLNLAGQGNQPTKRIEALHYFVLPAAKLIEKHLLNQPEL